MGELILTKKNQLAENKEYYLKIILFSAVLIGLFFLFDNCFASLETKEAINKGKGIFKALAEVIGIFFIVIGSVSAIWGVYTFGMAVKDGVSGQGPQSLTAILGGVLMAVAGFIMKTNGDKLFNTN